MRSIVFLERINTVIGNAVAYLCLFMAAITLIVVVLRYGFEIGSIALQESILYMHATFVMLGLAYAMQFDSHVRVDIVYSNLSPRTKDLVNLAGHAFFMLPLAILLIVYSWDYVLISWRIKEASPEAGGIPGIYLLKSLIPLSAVLLILQAFVETVRTAMRLLDRGA